MSRILQRSVLTLALLGAMGLPCLVMAETAPETHSTAVAAHEENKPELVSFDKGEAIWIIIIFVILVFLLKQTAWKNILAGLKAREERIRKDIADAEAARLKAESSLRDYSTQLASLEGKAREMFAAATADGERAAAAIRARAQQEAEESRERALRDIETARKQAVSEIYDQAAVLSTSIAEKIIRRSLNPDDQRDLVARSLEQLQGIGKN